MIIKSNNNSVYTWFKDGSKYSRKELIINWILIFNWILIIMFMITLIAIRWKYLVGALNGSYPAFLWCPIWAGIVLSILVIIEIITIVEKLRCRKYRLKYHNKSSVNSALRNTTIGKRLDHKYETIEDKGQRRKHF